MAPTFRHERMVHLEGDAQELCGWLGLVLPSPWGRFCNAPSLRAGCPSADSQRPPKQNGRADYLGGCSGDAPRRGAVQGSGRAIWGCMSG